MDFIEPMRAQEWARLVMRYQGMHYWLKVSYPIATNNAQDYALGYC